MNYTLYFNIDDNILIVEHRIDKKKICYSICNSLVVILKLL